MLVSPTPPEVIRFHHTGLIKVLVWSSQTGGGMGVIESTIAPGGGPTWHKHSREDELFYVVSGMAEVRVEDVVYRCKPGDRVLGPRNIFHTFRNVGDADLKMVIAFTPGGFEQNFVDSSELASQGVAPDDVLRITAERYGLTRGPTPPWD